MADMSEQSARATLSPLVERVDPDDLIAAARGEPADLQGRTLRGVQTVVENFGEDATVALVDEIRAEREEMGALRPQVPEEGQATIGEGPEATRRASEQARRRRDEERGAGRERTQMDLETAAGTRRLGQFEEEAEAPAAPAPTTDPTRVEGRPAAVDASEFWTDRDQQHIRDVFERWADPSVNVDVLNAVKAMNLNKSTATATTLRDAGLGAPADFVRHFERRGGFEEMEGVGPGTSRRIEAAIPFMRDALEASAGAGAGAEADPFEGDLKQVGLGTTGAGTFALPASVNGWELHSARTDANPGNAPAWVGRPDERVSLFRRGGDVTIGYHSPRLGGVGSRHVIARIEPGPFTDAEGVTAVDEQVEAAASEAVDWLRDHPPGTFRHPRWEPDAEDKLPPGWRLADFNVTSRKTRIRWTHDGTTTSIQAEGFPGTRVDVDVTAPDFEEDRGPEDYGVVIPSNPTVVQWIERMRRIAEAVDTDRDTSLELTEDTIRLNWPDLPGQAVQALLRNFDTVEEVRETAVGRVFDISGIGRQGIQAMIGERTDPRTQSMTIQEAIEREREQAREDDEGHGFEAGDRVRHNDGRTGTVVRATEAGVRVEWDDGREQVASPNVLEEIDDEAGDDLSIRRPVRVMGGPGSREVIVEGGVPEATLDTYPDEKQSDDPEAAFHADLASRVGEALGGDLDRVPPDTRVGTVIFEDTGRWRFDPTEDLPLEDDDEGTDRERAIDALAAGQWDQPTIELAFQVGPQVARSMLEMGDDASHVLKVEDNVDDFTEWPGVGEAAAKQIRETIPRLEARDITRFGLPLDDEGLERWKDIEAAHQADVEELGLTEGALPERPDDENGGA